MLKHKHLVHVNIPYILHLKDSSYFLGVYNQNAKQNPKQTKQFCVESHQCNTSKVTSIFFPLENQKWYLVGTQVSTVMLGHGAVSLYTANMRPQISQSPVN